MGQGNNRQAGYRDQGGGRGERKEGGRERDAPGTRPKAVFALTERNDRTYWTRIGVAFTNADGSITCKMEALPLSGQINIRDDDAQNDRQD